MVRGGPRELHHTSSHATGATMSGSLAGSTWGTQNAYTGCHTWCLPPYHQPSPLAPTMHPRCDLVHCVGVKALLPCAPHHTLGILGGTTWAECALACVWWVRYRHVTGGSEGVLRCVPWLVVVTSSRAAGHGGHHLRAAAAVSTGQGVRARGFCLLVRL